MVQLTFIVKVVFASGGVFTNAGSKSGQAFLEVGGWWALLVKYVEQLVTLTILVIIS